MTYAASSDSRNAADTATSSGVVKRLSGTELVRLMRSSSVGQSAAPAPSVSVGPGAMQLIADAVARPLHRQRARHRLHSSLRCSAVHDAGVTGPCVGRDDVEDRAAALVLDDVRECS